MELNPKSLLNQIDRLPVSEALAKALRIAQATGATEVSRWCRLELAGYWASNPAMNEEVVVPEYRTVVGQHADIYGRVLLLESDLAFVAETRLRNGIEELETLTRTREIVTIHDPHMCDLIRQHLQVEVYSFRFSAVHLTGILSAVRTELSEKLVALDRVSNAVPTSASVEAEEILELRPNLYGIGIDLRALWRRWKGTQ
jgi:hypothetical protein